MLQNTTTHSYDANIRPNLGTLQSEVRQALRDNPLGLTNKEVSKIVGRDASTVSGLMRPLVKSHQVYEAGERQCRVTGNNAKIWRLVIKGGTQPLAF